MKNTKKRWLVGVLLVVLCIAPVALTQVPAPPGNCSIRNGPNATCAHTETNPG